MKNMLPSEIENLKQNKNYNVRPMNVKIMDIRGQLDSNFGNIRQFKKELKVNIKNKKALMGL